MSTPNACPDGGTCHHGCPIVKGTGLPCFRVLTSGPLSGVYEVDMWPTSIVATHKVTEDGRSTAREITNQEAVTEIAEESPKAAGLVHAILEQSRRDIEHSTSLIEDGLRARVRELETAIALTLSGLDKAYQGSVREYERAVQPLRVHQGLLDGHGWSQRDEEGY